MNILSNPGNKGNELKIELNLQVMPHKRMWHGSVTNNYSSWKVDNYK